MCVKRLAVSGLNGARFKRMAAGQDDTLEKSIRERQATANTQKKCWDDQNDHSRGEDLLLGVA